MKHHTMCFSSKKGSDIGIRTSNDFFTSKTRKSMCIHKRNSIRIKIGSMENIKRRHRIIRDVSDYLFSYVKVGMNFIIVRDFCIGRSSKSETKSN